MSRPEAETQAVSVTQHSPAGWGGDVPSGLGRWETGWKGRVGQGCLKGRLKEQWIRKLE